MGAWPGQEFCLLGAVAGDANRGWRLPGAIAYRGSVCGRDAYGGGHVRREGYLVRKRIPGDGPRAGDRPAYRVIPAACPCQRPAWARVQEQSAESGAARLLVDAEQVPVEPFADRAERVVVERVHPRGLEAAAGLYGVPALPDRGGAIVEHVAPGRHALLGQEPVGNVIVAVRAEHGQQVANPGEPGREVPVRGPDRVDQPGGGLLLPVGWNKAHVQGQRVCGLRPGGHLTVGGHIGRNERRADLRRRRPVPRRVRGLPGCLRDLRHQRGVVRPVGGG
jgi:hypothetical protein